MKKLYILYLLVLFLCAPAWGQNLPNPMQPPRLVNDFTGLLKPDEQNLLERKLRNYLDTTSTQLYIVTVNDLDGYDIADYAPKLADKWGIGQKNKNNGLLILIKPRVGNQRGEIFIATGYGLEGAIPDAYVKRVIMNDIEPAFRDGEFYKGLDKATTTLMKMAGGEFKADEQNDDSGGGVIIFIIIMVGLILLFAVRKKGGGGGFTGSGGMPPIGGFGGLGGGGSRGGGFGGGFGGGGGGRFGGGGARGGW